MKKLIIIAALAIAGALFADTPAPASPETKPINLKLPTDVHPLPAVDVPALTKERDDLKAQLAQTTQAAQVEINRLQILAERNELAFRVTQLQQENQALRNQSAAEQAQIADLQKQLAEKSAPAKK